MNLREIEEFLELGHRVHLTAPFEGIDPFFWAITGSPSKYAARCSNSVKSSTLRKARCEPNSRWTLTPRRVGVSMRWRNSWGRISPTRWVEALVWPLA